MDNARFILESMFESMFIIGFWGFIQLLLHGFEDLAFRSPAAWKVMDVLTPLLGGVHPFEVGNSVSRETIYFSITAACTITVLMLLRENVDRQAKFISKALSQQYRTHAAFCVCGWSNIAAGIVAGGNLFFVGSLSAVSIAVVSAFKLVATRQDCLVMARWVLAQSTVVTAIIVCQGYFLEAAVALLPILSAISAMATSGERLNDNYYWSWSAAIEDRKGSKSNELNQNGTINTASMAQKDGLQVVSIEEMWVIDLKPTEESEGFCGRENKD